MAYRFKKKESVAKAVKRLGRERIEHALECLKDANRAEAVHGVRKDIKKTRAVLRLTPSSAAISGSLGSSVSGRRRAV